MTEAAPPLPRRYSLAHLALLVPWVALVIDAWAPIRDNSFLWHIRAGEIQASAGSVLTEDPFSFTMLGSPWRTQSWLAELFYAWGEGLSDLGFVPWMLLTTTTVAFIAIGLLAFKYSGSLPSSAVVLLMSTVLLVSFLVPRPVIFSFALFPLVALAWVDLRFKWTVPFLMWVWASVHGSFILGLAYIGLTLIANREWKWLSTAIVAGLVTLMTAHGLGVVGTLVAFSHASDALTLLTEWRKPELWSTVFFPFVLGLALLVFGAWRRRIEPRHLWLIVPFLALGLTATRAVPPAWLAMVPVVSLSLDGLSWGTRPIFPTLGAAVFAVVVFILPFTLMDDGALDEERFPLEAIGALDESLTFHNDVVGGFLIWAAGPGRLVYVDDRAELYGDQMREFVDVRDGRIQWVPVFEEENIRQVLLDVDEELVGGLMEAGWREVFRDHNFVVLRP